MRAPKGYGDVESLIKSRLCSVFKISILDMVRDKILGVSMLNVYSQCKIGVFCVICQIHRCEEET